MNYRNNRNGEPISQLGYGCMRFTKKGGKIDIDKAELELMLAFKRGVNYFDTAYMYGGNEEALGEILERNGIRDKVNIATKLPHYLVRNLSGTEKIFREELRRLRTDWVDYYLIHFLTDVSQWEKLKRFGFMEWVEEKKRTGQIRNIGFSFHGNTESFLTILGDYDWDFCMIQYNYMDEHTQAGREGLQAAAARGVPVIIMEPLRGGKLVGMLPDKARKLIQDSGTGFSPAELAFRWLWDQPEVTCILSGMNSMDMVDENCRIASDAKAGDFTEEHHDLIRRIRDSITETLRIGCTECGYCQPCPQGVDIPGIFNCYNRMFTEKRLAGMKDYLQSIALRNPPAFASQCNGCGRCERHCPQHIRIRRELKKAGRSLMPLPIRPAVALARVYLKLGRKQEKTQGI